MTYETLANLALFGWMFFAIFFLGNYWLGKDLDKSKQKVRLLEFNFECTKVFSFVSLLLSYYKEKGIEGFSTIYIENNKTLTCNIIFNSSTIATYTYRKDFNFTQHYPYPKNYTFTVPNGANTQFSSSKEMIEHLEGFIGRMLKKEAEKLTQEL